MNGTQITNIILAVLGLIGVGDLIRLIFFRATKKEVNAKADNVAIEGYKTALENLSDENDRLKHKYDAELEENKKLRDIIAEKDAVIAERDARLVAVYDDICVHKGCRIRKPHQGQGKHWYDQYQDDPSLGCDFESIDTLLKRDRAKRLAENILQKESLEKSEED